MDVVLPPPQSSPIAQLSTKKPVIVNNAVLDLSMLLVTQIYQTVMKLKMLNAFPLSPVVSHMLIVENVLPVLLQQMVPQEKLMPGAMSALVHEKVYKDAQSMGLTILPNALNATPIVDYLLMDVRIKI